MVIDIHHEGTIESHPYRIREQTPEGWRLVLNFAGVPRKFRTMQEAADWAKQRQDYGTAEETRLNIVATIAKAEG